MHEYKYAVTGKQLHTAGALVGTETAYKIRFVAIDSCRDWFRGVQHNERVGVLGTRKLTCHIVDLKTGNFVETLLGGAQ